MRTTLVTIALCAFGVITTLGTATALVGCDERTEKERLQTAQAACDGKLMYEIVSHYRRGRNVRYRNFKCIPHGVEVIVK